jgi:hypothetical protein
MGADAKAATSPAYTDERCRVQPVYKITRLGRIVDYFLSTTISSSFRNLTGTPWAIAGL